MKSMSSVVASPVTPFKATMDVRVEMLDFPYEPAAWLRNEAAIVAGTRAIRAMENFMVQSRMAFRIECKRVRDRCA